jgi:hypothetical protein
METYGNLGPWILLNPRHQGHGENLLICHARLCLARVQHVSHSSYPERRRMDVGGDPVTRQTSLQFLAFSEFDIHGNLTAL